MQLCLQWLGKLFLYILPFFPEVYRKFTRTFSLFIILPFFCGFFLLSNQDKTVFFKYTGKRLYKLFINFYWTEGIKTNPVFLKTGTYAPGYQVFTGKARFPFCHCKVFPAGQPEAVIFPEEGSGLFWYKAGGISCRKYTFCRQPVHNFPVKSPLPGNALHKPRKKNSLR